MNRKRIIRASSQRGEIPKVPPELAQWLLKTFPKRCIGAGEDLVSAHRYAAKVELADQLIRSSKFTEDSEGIHHQQE